MQHDPDNSNRLPVWLIPNITVFFSSACIMMVELVAGRIIAPHLGMSLYTWTAIIGVIMAGISLGNYLGGKIADRCRTRRALTALFFLAALGCAVILPLNAFIGNFSPAAQLSWPVRIFTQVFLVFIAPAMFLGMIHPVVAKMALDYKRAAGRTVGGVFAWSVAGSLVGTFATGFHLIMIFGATAILLAAALGLAALGVVYALLAMLTHEERPGMIAKDDNHTLWTTLSRWTPAAVTVFISNMAFMIFELAAMRVAAQEFGGSLYTWTTVIGVVLGGVTLGNYLGGRLADRSRSNTLIMIVFLLSAITVLISPTWCIAMHSWRRQIFFLAGLSWPMQIFVHVMAFCFTPCLFIGMVSPIVTGRLLAEGRAPGASVGAIYAYGSVGAIFGTFLAGYFLIQWMGALPVIALTALLLIIVAMAYRPRNLLIYAAGIVFLFALLAALGPNDTLAKAGEKLRLRTPKHANVVYEDESQYSYIAVRTETEDANLRIMQLDQLTHSQIDLSDPTRLLYEYEWIYSAVMEKNHPHPQPVRAFVIGGGGYAYPNYLVHARPESAVVVAEIDPAVTEAAHIALGLPRDTPILIHNMDARNVAEDLLRQATSDPNFVKFDYIFGDSINDYTVPYHLTTLEFNEMVNALLTDDGVYMLNMIDMLDSGGFLAAVVNTCRKVFPHVAVFNTGRLSFIRDTFVLVCSKQPLSLNDIPLLVETKHPEYAGTMLSESTLNGLIEKHHDIILTDDFAPVENLIAPVVRTRAGDLGELNLRFARRYAGENDTERAIQHCRAAITIHPQWPEAYELLAELLFKQKEVDGGLEALVNAASGHKQPGAAWYNAGRAAFDAGRADMALECWKNCVAVQPDHVAGWYNLGVLFGSRNDLKNAVIAWQNALAHKPDHEDSLYNLVTAYVMMQDGAAASATLDTMRKYGFTVDENLVNAVQALASQAPPLP